jgi:hypothetical protein
MKKIFILMFAALLFGFGKPKAADYKLSFSTYNHAEGVNPLIYSYSLKGNELNVVLVFMGADSRSEDQYTVSLTPQAIARLEAIKLDGLENEYINRCIPADSGAEYEVDSGYGNETKNIHLYHYYKEEIAQLVAELNKLVPEKYRIDYVDAGNRQDCP